MFQPDTETIASSPDPALVNEVLTFLISDEVSLFTKQCAVTATISFSELQ